MDEQLTLSGFEPASSAEVSFLNSLLPDLVHSVDANGGLSSLLSTNVTEGYTVLFYGNLTAFRLKMRGKIHYISIPTLFLDLISPDAPQKAVSAEPKYRRVIIDEKHPASSYAEMLIAIAGETVNRYPKEWDCCSLYLQCSDARKCVQSDKLFSLGCGYRKILSSGRIFYGKNRNVD